MARPRNITGHVIYPANERSLLELLGRTEIGGGAYPIGHYDGGISVVLPAADEFFRLLAYPGHDRWHVLGHSAGGSEEASLVARRVASALSGLGLPCKLCVHALDEEFQVLAHDRGGSVVRPA